MKPYEGKSSSCFYFLILSSPAHAAAAAQHISWSLYLTLNFHPQYGLLSYSEILCPLHQPPARPPPSLPPWSQWCLLSSSWPSVSRTSFCWSTRGAEGCRWRAESSRQRQPSPAREQEGREGGFKGQSTRTTKKDKQLNYGLNTNPNVP